MRSRLRTKVIGAAVVVVATAALAGCTGGDGTVAAGPRASASAEPLGGQPTLAVTTPSTAPTVSATPPAVPAASATHAPAVKASGIKKPKRPAGMDKNTAAGARATVQYFIQLYPYVLATGDFKEFDRLGVKGDGGCGFCATVHARASYDTAGKLKYSGGEISSRITKTYDRDTLLNGFPIDVIVSQKDAKYTDRSGKVIEDSPGATSLMRAEVVWLDGRWQLLEMATQAG